MSQARSVEQLVTVDEPGLLLVGRVSDISQRDALPAQKKRLLHYAESKGMPYAYCEFDESAFHKSRREEF